MSCPIIVFSSHQLQKQINSSRNPLMVDLTVSENDDERSSVFSLPEDPIFDQTSPSISSIVTFPIATPPKTDSNSPTVPRKILPPHRRLIQTSSTTMSPSTLDMRRITLSNFHDKISVEDQKKSSKMVARAFYENGWSFNSVEADSTLKMFKFLRPAFTPPNRRAVSALSTNRTSDKLIMECYLHRKTNLNVNHILPHYLSETSNYVYSIRILLMY